MGTRKKRVGEAGKKPVQRSMARTRAYLDKWLREGMRDYRADKLGCSPSLPSDAQFIWHLGWNKACDDWNKACDERRITDLGHRLVDVKQEAARLKAEYQDARVQIQELYASSRELVAVTERTKDLEKSLDMVQRNFHDTDVALAQTATRATELQAQLSKRDGQLGETQERLDFAMNQIEYLQADIHRLKARAEEAREDRNLARALLLAAIMGGASQLKLFKAVEFGSGAMGFDLREATGSLIRHIGNVSAKAAALTEEERDLARREEEILRAGSVAGQPIPVAEGSPGGTGLPRSRPSNPACGI